MKLMDIFKAKKILALGLILLMLSGCAGINEADRPEPKNLDEFSEIVEEVEIKMYEDIVVNYKSLSLSEMEKLLESAEQEQPHYFYFGRTTCVYCRKFIIENSVPIESVANFYYLDTATFSDEEKDRLSDYGIEHIPAILTASNSENIEIVELDSFTEKINN